MDSKRKPASTGSSKKLLIPPWSILPCTDCGENGQATRESFGQHPFVCDPCMLYKQSHNDSLPARNAKNGTRSVLVLREKKKTAKIRKEKMTLQEKVDLVEHTTIKKPWGSEIIWAKSAGYLGKIIRIQKGESLSRQYHEVKTETIIVISGILRLETGCNEEDDIQIAFLSPGKSFHVDPFVIHRFCADESDVELIEVSTDHLDDVIRLEDKYSR